MDARTEPASFEAAYPYMLTAVGEKLFFVASRRLWVTDGTSDGTTEPDPSIPGVSVTGIAALAGNAYFTLRRGSPARCELWRSDGTRAGTRLVASVDGWSRVGPTAAGDRLYFSAGKDLWTSDGSPEGTRYVATIGSGFYDELHALTPLGDRVVFTRWHGSGYHDVWSSDGSSAGTRLLHWSGALEFHSAGSFVYFVASDGGTAKVWKTDGTSEGTVPLRDVDGGTFAPSAWTLRAVPMEGALYFVADDRGRALWRTDGTPAGTRRVSALGSPTAVTGIARAGRRVFVATSGPSRLWVSDGTSDGTSEIANVEASGVFAGVGDRLFFGVGSALWVSDGTALGTRIVRSDSNVHEEIAGLGSIALFRHFDEVDGSELWRSDGTSEGTHLVVDLSVRPSLGGWPWPLGDAGSTVYLASDGDVAGSYWLWRSDGTPAGTARIRQVAVDDALCEVWATCLKGVGPVGDKFIFLAGGGALWRTDGTTENTRRIARVAAKTPGVQFAGALYFVGTAGASSQLWRTDGTSEGTVPVTTLASGSLDSLTVMGDRMYFLDDRDGVRRLWRSDGTGAGTVLVASAPAYDGWPDYLMAAGRLLFFPAGGPTSVLWRSDGTSVGTFPLPGVKSPGRPVALGGNVYVAASVGEPASGWGLFKSDGTSEGTMLVRLDLGGVLAVAGDTLFVRTGSWWQGYELWAGDGTSDGMRFLAAGLTGDPGDWPALALEREGLLLFTVCDRAHGCELWRSDGTSDGTGVVVDLYPGYQSSNALPLMRFRDTVLFRADHPVTGTEMWGVHVGSLAPLACPQDIVAEASGQDGSTVGFVVDVSPHYQGTVVYSHASGARFPIGATRVTVRAPEAYHRCAFTVTVRDTTPPSVTCPADVVVEATGPQGAQVAYAAATASDSVSAPVISYSAPSGSTFPVGTTSVVASARDAAGNTATCAFQVVVRDTTPPQITCPEDLRAEATGPDGAPAQWPAAGASDLVSTPSVTYAPELGTILPLGESLVTAQARDAAGNAASCSFSVLVEDTTPPRIDCPTRVFVEATGPDGGPASWEDVVIADLVSAPVVISSLEPGALLPFGDTPLELLAVDEAGNASTCKLLLTVRDSLPPDIVCPSDFAVVAGDGGAAVTLPPAHAQDLVTSAPVVAIDGGEERNLAPGTHVIHASAIDEAGNRSTCAFVVTVSPLRTSATIGCGCGASATESGVALWFLLAVAGLRARRRAHQRQR